MGKSMLKIAFRADAAVQKTVPMGIVLDLDADGRVIGIEILNLKLEAGQTCLERFSEDIAHCDGTFSFAYDDDADAFYLHIHEGYSVNQVAMTGKLQFDKAGCIIGLETETE